MRQPSKPMGAIRPCPVGTFPAEQPSPVPFGDPNDPARRPPPDQSVRARASDFLVPLSSLSHPGGRGHLYARARSFCHVLPVLGESCPDFCGRHAAIGDITICLESDGKHITRASDVLGVGCINAEAIGAPFVCSQVGHVYLHAMPSLHVRNAPAAGCAKCAPLTKALNHSEACGLGLSSRLTV